MPTNFRGIACAAFASLMLAVPVAAQQATQVALIEGDAPGDYRAAGAVAAEIQSASNVLPKAKLDEQLRAEAVKLGADAVIQVIYQMTPADSGVSYKASGVAIRYSRQAGAVASVPAPAPAAPAVVAPVATTPAATVPTAPPVVAAVAPPVAAAPPPVAASAPAPVVAAAPALVRRAGSAADVQLSDGALAGVRVVRVGPVSVTTHPTSMFMKVTPKEQTQEALKAAAFKMGADAVIEVKYQMVNSTFSKKGNTATGVAVKFE